MEDLFLKVYVAAMSYTTVELLLWYLRGDANIHKDMALRIAIVDCVALCIILVIK